MEKSPNKPRRQRRLDRLFDSAPAYFLTLCTYDRQQVLATSEVLDQARGFAEESVERYGVFVDAYVLMPDHVHLIVSIAMDSKVTVGSWVKAFKAVVAMREFKWQAGFFDHVLRSDESRSEKWEYIRQNPVRAGLVDDPEQWPYAERFSRHDGSKL